MSGPALPQRMVSESKPVLVLASIVAGASALTGVLAAVPGVPSWVVVALAAVTAVGTAIGGVLTQKQTVPWEDVAAKQTPSGAIVAGPAADQRNGTAVVVSPDLGPQVHTHSPEGDLL